MSPACNEAAAFNKAAIFKSYNFTKRSFILSPMIPYVLEPASLCSTKPTVGMTGSSYSRTLLPETVNPAANPTVTNVCTTYEALVS